MKLTITQEHNHYVVTDSAGLVLRILTKKGLAWNLRHAFGFNSNELREIGHELKQAGHITLTIGAAA